MFSGSLSSDYPGCLINVQVFARFVPDSVVRRLISGDPKASRWGNPGEAQGVSAVLEAPSWAPVGALEDVNMFFTFSWE